MSFQFITAIPLNVWKGSGCVMGIDTLAKGIRSGGGLVSPADDAAAVPEVVRHGLLVEPENHDALAYALEKLYGDSQLRASLACLGRQDVESYDMRRVARRFMEIVSTGAREGEVIAQ